MIGATSSPRLAWQVRSRTILDSTNNIITRNPRVQERFDLPYLLRRDPADWRGDEGSLALCKLMPLDNDTYDVKMPSLEGKAWAGAIGDWVVYIGSNCEWELVNVYTRDRVPPPKISENCPEVEHTGIVRTFKYNHGDCLLCKIAICRVPNRSWNYNNYQVVAIFDKLVAVLCGSTRCILLKNQFLYTDVYCDAFNMRVLCLLPPLMALFLHGILVVSVCLSSTVIIIVSSTCMRVSKFPLLINLLLVFPRSCEHSTTYT